MTCFLVLAHQVKYAEDAGYSAVLAVSAFAFYGVATLLGQSSAWMSDRIGREKAMVLCCASALVGLLALIAIRDTSHPWLLYIYALGFGYAGGLFSATIFAGAADIFHGKQFGTASGMILTGMGLGGAIGPWLGGYLYDTTGSYDIAFILCLVCIVLSSVSFWIAAPRNADKLRDGWLKSQIEKSSI
ncbi:MAG: MFS transporter [Deltaproteobacteria bacterium]|nr:MFS transporter [Deltaproteobacteria bacterium]